MCRVPDSVPDRKKLSHRDACYECTGLPLVFPQWYIYREGSVTFIYRCAGGHMWMCNWATPPAWIPEEQA